ncbi:hypothetical protein ACODT4_44715 [Streptomyces sp. 2.9]|uniref:hypothetical protein n=1 Tax=Streptomyces tritrimontium TaxID=3406573 RepID=UPI003BB62935
MTISGLFSNQQAADPAKAPAPITARTDDLMSKRPKGDPVALLDVLADQLPKLDDVREVADDDDSPLSETEQRQKEATEKVMATAATATETAFWIVAGALERAARGRWWRGEFPTYDAYVQAKVGRSSSYVRRLRAAAPLALETGSQLGMVPNPGQAREQRRTEQKHGRAAAIALFGAVAGVAAEVGDAPTAAHLAAVNQALPDKLPQDPQEQAAVIEQTARETLGVPIGTPGEDAPAGGVPIGTPGGEPAVSLADARELLRELRRLNKAFTKDSLRQLAAHPEYVKLHADLLATATTVRNKIAQAPPAAVEDPADDDLIVDAEIVGEDELDADTPAA